SSAFLSKLAKHLAVLACLAIVGETSGRFVIGQRGILVLVVSAALVHSAARALQHRLQCQIRGDRERWSRFNAPGSTL
ncbi:MAG TPA: hypothetical protein VLD83_11340, partial [Candidatus Binatia bacterium]|nr:hypothetical protein [Candidatus Binatia bacterium]